MRYSASSIMQNIFILLMCLISTITALNLTETEFRKVLEGRCEEYQRLFSSKIVIKKKNCGRATNAFIKIFDTHGAACNESSYEPFVKMVQHDVPKDKGMLWSGFHPDFIERMALRGIGYYPISYTLTGYMLDQISICKDIFRTKPGCQGTCKSSTREFWKMASLYFARSLSGTATVVLSARNNGNGKGSVYYTKGIFATVEVPNLSPKVTGVVVWPVQSIQTKKSLLIKAKCRHPTTKIFENIMRKSGRKYRCIERSKVPLFAMCLERPDLCSTPKILNGNNPLMSETFSMVLMITTSCAFFKTYLQH